MSHRYKYKKNNIISESGAKSIRIPHEQGIHGNFISSFWLSADLSQFHGFPNICRPPKIHLGDTSGLSCVEKHRLLKDLQRLSRARNGREVIGDLVKLAQAYLHHLSHPLSSNVYQDMLAKMKPIHRIQEKQGPTRGSLQKRTKMIGSRSLNNVSPTERDGCKLHDGSKKLLFPSVGRKILRSSCLGHSRKGCIAYSGIDLKTGQLLYITEWTLKFSELKGKCTIDSQYESSPSAGHTVDQIIRAIEEKVTKMSRFRHKNLVAYECVSFKKKQDGVVIHLAQEFVHGAGVSRSMDWSYAGCNGIATGIIEALGFLHDQGVKHGNLDAGSVFLDNSGAYRVTDFALIPYMGYLTGNAQDTRDDLPALGCLIESLLQSPNSDSDALDFIGQCKSKRPLSTSELLAHPFFSSAQRTGIDTTRVVAVPTRIADNLRSVEGPSRFQDDFEYKEPLGRGSYGDVLKVKNRMDKRLYAIKRIRLTNQSGGIPSKIIREVELLACLDHANVVRYYNTWTERVSKAELMVNNDDDDYCGNTNDGSDGDEEIT